MYDFLAYIILEYLFYNIFRVRIIALYLYTPLDDYCKTQRGRFSLNILLICYKLLIYKFTSTRKS